MPVAYITLALCCAAGAALIAWWFRHHRGRSGYATGREERTEPAAEEVAAVALLERLDERFAEISSKALRDNMSTMLDVTERQLAAQSTALTEGAAAREQAIAGMLGPVSGALERMDTIVRELERDRKAGQGALGQQVRMVAQANEALRAQTERLTTALRTPHVRGRWGEMQLRRVVELAGMVERCDFEEQVAARNGAQRPDLVVNLPEGKRIVVDAKAPLQGLLEAIQATDPDERGERLKAHARHVRRHVDHLAGKDYWKAVAGSPDFVVLFIPGESFLAHALNVDADLMEHAFRRNVILATPSTLMGLLSTVAFSWRQANASDSAREILALGEELHGRLNTFVEHLQRVGKHLDSAVGAYNSSVSSLDRRVLVTARKLALHTAAGENGGAAVSALAPVRDSRGNLVPVIPGEDGTG